MAVAFEGFCIREFASKMRSADVVKSWPFGGDSDKEQIESALPPITVAKFRWWQHELDAAQSSHAAAHLEEKSEEPLFGCTVCGGFNASGNENAAAEAEIGDSEKKQSTRARSKTKAPKKRSIVEIFAVAPQIETVTRQEGSSTGRNSESTRVKKKKKKNASLKKRHLPILDRKLKKKVRRNPSFAMKEICHKFKRKTTSDLSRNFDRLKDKMCTSGKLEDADGTHRRNPSCKPSSSNKKHKHKHIAPSKFITKKHKEVATPIRGILKKQRKYVSGKDTAFTVPEENSQPADQLDKHVRFLVESDKIDGEANTHAVTKQSSLHEIFTGVDRLGRNEVDEAVSENDNSICVEELQVAKEKEITLPDTRGQGNAKNYVPLSTFQEDLNNFPVLPTSPNHHIPKFCGDLNRSTKGKSIVSDEASYPWHSRFLSTFNGASSNADVAGSSVRPVSFRSEFTSGSSRAAYAVSSVPRKTNTSLQSLNENVKDQRLPFPSQSMMSDSSFIPPHQMNPIGGSFSYKEWNPIGVTSSERSLHENLYGLPLNSRGELIHLSSSSNFMLDQQSGSSRRFLVHQGKAEDTIRFKGNHTRPKDLNLFPIQDSGGPMNLNPSSHLFGADLNLMCSNDEAATTTPVTMRLMGKDVSIGRNSRIRSEEEKVWTDKEIIVEHNNNNNNPSGTHFVKNFFPQEPVLKTSAPEKSRLVNISFGGQNNSDYYNFPPPDPYRVRDPYINSQPDAPVQIGRVPITRPTIFQVENVRDPYLNGGLRLGSHESNWIDIQWGPEPIYRPNHVSRVPYNFGFPSDCRECFPPPPHATSDRRNNTAYTNHRAQQFYGANRWCSSSSTQPGFHFPEPYYYNPMMRSPIGVENVHHSNYRVDSGGFGFRDHTRASKRPAVFDFDLRKPYKVPTLELLRPGIDFSDTIGRNVEHCELDLHNGKESNIQGGVSDRVVKPSPGPMKLRAGAKHILKPCQNTDNGKSGSSRSSIPFGGSK